jgi:hypothetical protein
MTHCLVLRRRRTIRLVNNELEKTRNEMVVAYILVGLQSRNLPEEDKPSVRIVGLRAEI